MTSGDTVQKPRAPLRTSGRSRPRQRRSTAFGWRWSQAAGGQAGLRAFAEAVGGGARFRVGVALSAVGQGLRAAACHGGGAALRRFGGPFPPPSDTRTRVESRTPLGRRSFLCGPGTAHVSLLLR